ncbi:MAG TPA: efflux RND transporter periplasmic adaptor subunit [Peptococcaceae bacterium]|nr:MAG: Efflux transporter, RND family, MFP subunit [Clostridia bacterium 41_269]HBT20604.1 efflux RND transporter periplasmic adaptor subunit [Peptococcaceae bacterium]
MKRRKKIYLGLGIIAILAVGALVFTNQGTEVETVRVKQGSITRKVVDTGYVQPVTESSLYATQNARVVRVLVETGQSVKKGQTLAILENRDLAIQINEVRTRLAQAEANASSIRAAMERIHLELENAQENLSRVKELYMAGAATKAKFEAAQLKGETYQQSLKEQQSQLDSILAQVSGLRENLEQLTSKEKQLTIRSPIGGIILNLPIEEHQVLAPGILLATVADPNKLEVKTDILSDDLREVKVGQKVTITSPVLGERKLVGKVKEIYPRAVEKQSSLGVIQRRVPVIISLNDPANLKPGYEVKVAIETLIRSNVLLVPHEAARTLEDGRKEVMAVVDGRIKRRLVETGISDNENIEIISGLQLEDEIIKDGSLDLKDKAKVKPVRVD